MSLTQLFTTLSTILLTQLLLVKSSKQWGHGHNNNCPGLNVGMNSRQPNLIENGNWLPEHAPGSPKPLKIVVNSLEDFFYFSNTNERYQPIMVSISDRLELKLSIF